MLSSDTHTSLTLTLSFKGGCRGHTQDQLHGQDQRGHRREGGKKITVGGETMYPFPSLRRADAPSSPDRHGSVRCPAGGLARGRPGAVQGCGQRSGRLGQEMHERLRGGDDLPAAGEHRPQRNEPAVGGGRGRRQEGGRSHRRPPDRLGLRQR